MLFFFSKAPLQLTKHNIQRNNNLHYYEFLPNQRRFCTYCSEFNKYCILAYIFNILIMRYLYGLLFIVCFLSCKEEQTPTVVETPIQETITTTTYYLIRHAEKDRSDPENRNPSLIEAGQQRANQWATVFQDVPFDLVYSTDYARTQETATPTATQKGLEIQSYNPRTLFDENFQKATEGKTVLVVGHSNSTPSFVNAILGKQQFEQIDDSNNGNLYIITVTGDEKSAQLLHFN